MIHVAISFFILLLLFSWFFGFISSFLFGSFTCLFTSAGYRSSGDIAILIKEIPIPRFSFYFFNFLTFSAIVFSCVRNYYGFGLTTSGSTTGLSADGAPGLPQQQCFAIPQSGLSVIETLFPLRSLFSFSLEVVSSFVCPQDASSINDAAIIATIFFICLSIQIYS